MPEIILFNSRKKYVWFHKKPWFAVDTGDQGVYELEFMRDESSEYTKFHVNNEALAMDVIGEKIKE